jgi:hypothetical protein
MKRYILLIGNDYYPCGLDDFFGDFETEEEAISVGMKNTNKKYEWFEILDIVEKKVYGGGGWADLKGKC